MKKSESSRIRVGGLPSVTVTQVGILQVGEWDHVDHVTVLIEDLDERYLQSVPAHVDRSAHNDFLRVRRLYRGRWLGVQEGLLNPALWPLTSKLLTRMRGVVVVSEGVRAHYEEQLFTWLESRN